jgi:hypothetical protein
MYTCVDIRPKGWTGRSTKSDVKTQSAQLRCKPTNQTTSAMGLRTNASELKL